jgi:hypothetical protein
MNRPAIAIASRGVEFKSPFASAGGWHSARRIFPPYETWITRFATGDHFDKPPNLLIISRLETRHRRPLKNLIFLPLAG